MTKGDHNFEKKKKRIEKNVFRTKRRVRGREKQEKRE